mmetsp:Transcript_6017/g.9973  ORF Transcript_6017/g.9973 Transcript_6017/m.9973 type:complete len:112 (+) Transcript_6017:23-358(+)|eukprot:CAMPEP_0197027290 /NCGR_PEP_ID=MMETSP1384-20130603/7235_1 /TAXON_ID=29189 /ORGANISM="Ammonia sp." /LENGTH=111 /DNA_ID=CAMNT_0042456117 /DNA_START=23 /DNA_END=358 /DNA_ORIENTATION=+
MSATLLREHLREYHSHRFKKEIAAHPSYDNFAGTAIQNAPLEKQKKIVGKKIKRKIRKERKQIISYQKEIQQNVQHNISVLKQLNIRTDKDVPQWQHRLDLIKNATTSFGN